MQRLLALSMIAAGLVTFTYANTAQASQDTVVICHAAGQDDTTKFVTLRLPIKAVFGKAGHFNENGTAAAGHEDDYLGPCVTPPTTVPETTIPETTTPPTTTPPTTVPETTIPETTIPETTVPETTPDSTDTSSTLAPGGLSSTSATILMSSGGFLTLAGSALLAVRRRLWLP